MSFGPPPVAAQDYRQRRVDSKSERESTRGPFWLPDARSAGLPFVIAGAGVTRRGREDAIVNTADLYATILELAGLSIGHVNNSYSLKPLLTDEDASSGRTLNVTESCNASNPNGNRSFAIRDARFKIVATNGVYSLFDLHSDPLEATDLYNDPAYAAQRASLLAEIETLKASSVTGCW